METQKNTPPKMNSGGELTQSHIALVSVSNVISGI